MKYRNINISIRELKSNPITDFIYNKKEISQNYNYRNKLFNITLDNDILSNEPLVNCNNYDLLNKNYYYNIAINNIIPSDKLKRLILKNTTSDVFLRRNIAIDLQIIDKVIKRHGLRLFILSGYRSAELQSIIRKVTITEKGKEFTEKMLADPDTHLPHATGAAFDIEIFDLKANKLLPTKISNHFERNYLEQKQCLTKKEIEVRDNRRLIHNLLATSIILPKDKIFVPHPYEYWHYSRNEKLSTVFSHMYGISHKAFYDEITNHISNQ